MGRMNGGTRRLRCPDGEGVLTDGEALGNLMAALVVSLCLELAAVGAHFSVENPDTSYLWTSSWMLDLCAKVKVFEAKFDQCAYGLKLPPFNRADFCKKGTIIWSTSHRIGSLRLSCPGTSATHKHVHPLGSVRYKNQTIALSRAAGAYPPSLCLELARVVMECKSHKERSHKNALHDANH